MTINKNCINLSDHHPPTSLPVPSANLPTIDAIINVLPEKVISTTALVRLSTTHSSSIQPVSLCFVHINSINTSTTSTSATERRVVGTKGESNDTPITRAQAAQKQEIFFHKQSPSSLSPTSEKKKTSPSPGENKEKKEFFLAIQ